MKAIVLTNTGSLKNLILKQLPNPVIHKDETPVKVDYCGVNHLDLLIVEGKRPTYGRLPLILGSEITGNIEETGQKVAVYPWTFCKKCSQCQLGNMQICDHGGTLGRTRQGGYAEYVSVPKENLVYLDRKADERSICSVTLSGTTALHMIKRAKIPDSTTVLLNGATGGVGTVAIQILKSKKCRVIARTSHRNKVKFLKQIGADTVLVNKFPESVPYIIDAMGGSIWTKSVEILSKNGTLVFCATSLDGTGSVNIGNAFNKLNILGSYGGTLEDLKEVIDLVNRGIIKPVIDSVFPLKKVQQALKKIQGQKALGKILIKVN